MTSKIITIPGKISSAKFLNRPNRFLVNLLIEGIKEPQQAFLHDPGRMKELLIPKALLLVRRAVKKERKTQWDVLGVKTKDKIVVINSSLPNLVAKQAIIHGWLEELSGWKMARPEVTVNNSRLDFLLINNDKKCYVEVKGVTLVENNRALFPDAPTSRGTRHLRELIFLKKEGFRSVVLFICMREDPLLFSPNTTTDRLFSEQLRKARDNGVEILVYKIRPTIEEEELKLYFQNRLKIEIE